MSRNRERELVLVLSLGGEREVGQKQSSRECRVFESGMNGLGRGGELDAKVDS